MAVPATGAALAGRVPEAAGEPLAMRRAANGRDAASVVALAAAEAVGYRAIGTDRDAEYLQMGRRSFAELAAFRT